MTSGALPLSERTVPVGDLMVHVNEKGDGPVVFVLHHSTGPFWSSLYDKLSDGFSVMAPDMPGYGQSTRPVLARNPVHLAVLLNQLLDGEERDGVHLVGFGFGGWVAAEMAAMNQRRLASLTLVGAAGIKPREGFIHDPMTESWVDYAQRGFRDTEHFAAVFGAEPPQEVIDLWDYSREMTARITWKPWMWSLTLPTLLRAVATPALIVWGREDAIVPLDCGEQYAELLPNARLEIVEDAGHLVEFEEPDRMKTLISDFAMAAAR
jgi:pimeloyl-ACP methyl ester carboxylesterase